MATMGAPSDSRYLGRNRRHRFSPRAMRNMAATTARVLRSSESRSRRRVDHEWEGSVGESAGRTSEPELILASEGAAPRSLVRLRGPGRPVGLGVAPANILPIRPRRLRLDEQRDQLGMRLADALL